MVFKRQQSQFLARTGSLVVLGPIFIALGKPRQNWRRAIKELQQKSKGFCRNGLITLTRFP